MLPNCPSLETPTNSSELVLKAIHNAGSEGDLDVSTSDDKESANESINTSESTLPESGSDDSFNSSRCSSPMSPLAQNPSIAPQTPLEQEQQQQQQQQEAITVSPLPLNSTTTTTTTATAEPQTPNSVTQSPQKPPSKAQSLRDRRRMMEAWHDEQKSKSKTSSRSMPSTATYSPFSTNSKRKLTTGSSKSLMLTTTRKGTKEEMARYKRMVDRLLEAEKQANNRMRGCTRQGKRAKDARERMLALRERAELKLRQSQMEKARHFYQALIAAKQIEAIPMEILKTINELPNYQPRHYETLGEELEAFLAQLRVEDPEEAACIAQEILEWKDSATNALPIGSYAPDFCLEDHKGEVVDSRLLRQEHWRLIVVFYHDYDSAFCKMNLTALEHMKKTYEAEGAKLIGIGFEPDTTDTVEETEVSFPLLADEAGILATKFGIIRVEELPICSTFVIDHDGSILWSYVNTDYTKRPEPMEILEALPSKSRHHHNRKSFFRPSFKKK